MNKKKDLQSIMNSRKIHQKKGDTAKEMKERIFGDRFE